jgi:hypothetical protein
MPEYDIENVCKSCKSQAARTTIGTNRILMGLIVGLLWVHGAAGVLRADLDYTVSWVGNSFSGADDKWVQNFFIHMVTQPDGTCNTWSHWDEGGKKFGVYKDGDVIGNRDVGANSLEVTDKKGRLWKLMVKYVDPGNNEYDFVPVGIRCDGAAVTFPELHQPTALALANDGTLMVADSLTGPRQQILFYDVSDVQNPKLVRTFGQYGGIASGKPGEVKPAKFWGIRGIGMDRDGNIYVAMSEMGTVLRKFSPEGKLIWQLYGHFFVDVACPDPSTDGRDMWGIQEHYVMDYSKPPGEEAQWVGYSLDRHRYPDDPRGLMFVKQQGEHGLTSPQIVYLQGKRFMFIGGMFASNFINIFRYDDEIAIPSGLIMQWTGGLYRTDLKWPPGRPEETFIWRDRNGDGNYQENEYESNCQRVHPGPFWVDKQGNIWMAYNFFRYDFQGLDEHGNPVYSSDNITIMDKPKGLEKVARVWYDADRDILVAAEEGRDMRHISEVLICKNYLAGSRDAVTFVPGAKGEAACVAAAGDYVFTGGWKERGRIRVNRISDGAEVGFFDPGPTLGGVENTGWIDVMTGIIAYKRDNSEYLICVEEDYKAKSIIYRWRP